MRKNNKRALIVSCLSLLLCVSMLVGTTFAWFTDNATTGVNKIESGTLDIELVDKDGESLEGKTLMFADKNGKTDILFEPGATFLSNGFKVVNVGNLEAKYKISITGIDGDAELLDVIEFSLVTDSGEAELEGGTSSDFVGEWEITFDPETGEAVTTQTSAPASELMYIKAHMKEDAGNEYQGKTLTGVAILVQATQETYEYDSFDNQYDKDAAYAAADNLYITEPGEYTIDLTKTNYIFKGEEIQDTLAAVKVDTDCSATITGNGTVKINVTDVLTSSAIAVWARNGGQIVIEDGTYIMERIEENHQEIELIYVSGTSSAITIKGGTFKSDNPRLTLNIHNNSNGTITVMGGTYWEFNPENAEDAGVIIPEGYKVVEEVKADGTWYTVVTE